MPIPRPKGGFALERIKQRTQSRDDRSIGRQRLKLSDDEGEGGDERREDHRGLGDHPELNLARA